jgi:hypothetical protein
VSVIADAIKQSQRTRSDRHLTKDAADAIAMDAVVPTRVQSDPAGEVGVTHHTLQPTSVESDRIERRRYIGRIIAAAAFVLLIGALATTTSQDDAPAYIPVGVTSDATPPLPETDVSRPALSGPTHPSVSPSDFRLSGILSGAGNAYAVINGTVLSEGQSIGQAVVVRIESETTRIRVADQEFDLAISNHHRPEAPARRNPPPAGG